MRAALGLPADQPLAMNRLRDVLAALKGSQLAWPEGMTPDLYRAIDVAVSAVGIPVFTAEHSGHVQQAGQVSISTSAGGAQ